MSTRRLVPDLVTLGATVRPQGRLQGVSKATRGAVMGVPDTAYIKRGSPHPSNLHT